MFRSLIAILAATLVGLLTAKFIEGAGLALLTAPEIDSAVRNAADGYGAVLVVAWAIGSFAAACCALLIGRRWALLGGLAAATVFLSAMIALVSSSLSWALWPLSMLATAGGGYGAIRLFRATSQYPTKKKERAIFDV